MTMYVHRPWQVDAVGWTGWNLDEVKKFFISVLPTAILQIDSTIAGRTVRGPSLEIIADSRRMIIRAESIIVVHRNPDIQPKIESIPPAVFKRSYVRG